MRIDYLMASAPKNYKHFGYYHGIVGISKWGRQMFLHVEQYVGYLMSGYPLKSFRELIQLGRTIFPKIIILTFHFSHYNGFFTFLQLIFCSFKKTYLSILN